MGEDEFVDIGMSAIGDMLGLPLRVRRKAALLYQVTVDNRLNIQENSRKPTRGQSAFETDLCIFEETAPDIEIPRVVLEFKLRLTTHDVLTYSTKARRHKQVYPYLRYGLVIGGEKAVPGRFFVHNEALDFCMAAASYLEDATDRLRTVFRGLVKDEVDTSRRLEKITFNSAAVRLYRNEVILFFDVL